MWLSKPELAIPAGIRHAFPLYTKPAHLAWDREALRGLVSVTTDRGPMKYWLWTIGRLDDSRCECGSAQSAVHLLRCPMVGDGNGRKMEEAERDPEGCWEVMRFLRR